MKRFIFIITLLFFASIAEAQKIKYKDLFFVLDTKNYKDGEPLLRKFLSDPKNADQPNANLQFAFLYNKKAVESDVIKESDEVVAYADSATMYYRKALELITEKEIKKNDEYYQAYQRRDVRTGKFGIKLADVSFDIQNKIKAIEDRKASVQELTIYYTKTLQNFNDALERFKQIKSEFPTEKILYLRSNDELLKELEELNKSAKLSLQNYSSFEGSLDDIDKTGYGPALHLTDIENYQEDGMSEIDLTADNIYFWDYESWTEKVKKGIKDIISPMRTELVTYDQSLNDLLERVSVDSMAMDDKIQPIDDILVKIREYDNDPLPEYLFSYKIAKIKLESTKMNHLYYRDSSDNLYQTEVALLKKEQIDHMDSLINILIGRNGLEDSKNYAHFIEKQYQDEASLELYIKSQLDETSNARKASESEISMLSERTKWLIGENDSIPLFEDVNIGLSKYVPLSLTDEFTAGLYFSGKSAAEGYFAMIESNLRQNLKVNFPIDTKYFRKQTLEDIKTLNAKERDGGYYYLLMHYQIPGSEEHPATIAKIYTSDGLAWSKKYLLDTEPLQLLINGNTGDLIIEYDMENYLGEKEIPDRLVLTKKGEKK